MEKIRQINIFDVLRGMLDKTSDTYGADVNESSGAEKKLPQPDVYVPPPLRPEGTNGSQDHPFSSKTLPNAPKVRKSWLSRNWGWLLLIVIAGVTAYFIYRHRKKRKEEEFRRQEGERLPKIDYPWPQEAGGLVHEAEPALELVPETLTPVEEFYKEMEQESPEE